MLETTSEELLASHEMTSCEKRSHEMTSCEMMPSREEYPLSNVDFVPASSDGVRSTTQKIVCYAVPTSDDGSADDEAPQLFETIDVVIEDDRLGRGYSDDEIYIDSNIQCWAV